MTNITSYSGVSVLLDVHNYARYRGQVIGESGGNVTAADFADLWSRLATKYGSSSKSSPILFGLMNEPHGMNTSTLVVNTNAAITAIRAAKAMNTITVCGNGYSGAHSWMDGGNGSNAVQMLKVVDPMSNMVFEMHQYLDHDSSGSHANCTLLNASVAMHDATAWLRANGRTGLLGEWAGADNAPCRVGVASMLRFLKENRDVWLGWSWWAAGPWWGDYMFSLEPPPPCPARDKPQESWLAPYLDATVVHAERGAGAAATTKDQRTSLWKLLLQESTPEELQAVRGWLGALDEKHE